MGDNLLLSEISLKVTRVWLPGMSINLEFKKKWNDYVDKLK